MQRLMRRGRLAVTAVLVIAGLLLATSAVTARGTDLRSGRRDQLPDLVRARAAQLEALTRQVQQRRAQVDAAGQDAARQDQRVADARARLGPLAQTGGLDPVAGPALSVSLNDSAGDTIAPGAPTPVPDDLVVHEQDVQAVVNALWAGGASALSVMDQRVVSTTSIRCVGNTLLLDGAVYSPPFVVVAVGDADAMRAELDASPGVRLFRRYVRDYGLGLEVSTEDQATVPGYRGPLRLIAAQPMGAS